VSQVFPYFARSITAIVELLVGLDVGLREGETVGFNVGLAVGLADGTALGFAVLGFPVLGFAEGNLVGELVDWQYGTSIRRKIATFDNCPKYLTIAIYFFFVVYSAIDCNNYYAS
jgi:hypothetical protein